ncbi:hypothetical protein [Klebsiella pneumoniae IS22]|nr:hypothetical protein [Klebsiella pneumoniae IS22]
MALIKLQTAACCCKRRKRFASKRRIVKGASQAPYIAKPKTSISEVKWINRSAIQVNASMIYLTLKV